MKTIIMISALVSMAMGDWPQFKQTPDRRGCDLTEQVTLPSKLCSWVDFGSPIRASASIVNGKAYAISGRGLLARIDLASNSVDWHVALGGVNNEGTPSVENGRVYVGTTAGKFHVLDAETGALIREYAAGAPILASPLLYRDGVYFGSTDGVFHALDMDGNLKWTFRANNHILYSAAADTGLITFADGYSFVYWIRDMQTYGDTVHVHRTPDYPGAVAIVSGPVMWGNRVYISRDCSEWGDVRTLLFNPVTDSVKDSAISSYVMHAPSSIDTSTGQFVCATSVQGLQSSAPWSWGSAGWGTLGYTVLGGQYIAVNSSPALTKDLVIFGSETDGIHFFRKDSVSVWTPPYKANVSTGCQLWRYAPPGCKPVEAAPAVSDGKVVVGSFDGCLYGFWDGTEVTSPVVVDPLSTEARKKTVMPGKWTLTAFPNPASAGCVSLEIGGKGQKAVISIFNLNGALIRELALQGKGAVLWDLKDRKNRPVASGNYYVKMRSLTGRTLKSFNLQVLR